MYEIPVEGITVNDEIVESYGNSNAVASLVVNENVYSPFNGDFNFSLVDAQDVNIPFGKYQINEQGDTYLTSYVDAKPGESVTIVPEKNGQVNYSIHTSQWLIMLKQSRLYPLWRIIRWYDYQS